MDVARLDFANNELSTERDSLQFRLKEKDVLQIKLTEENVRLLDKEANMGKLESMVALLQRELLRTKGSSFTGAEPIALRAHCRSSNEPGNTKLKARLTREIRSNKNLQEQNTCLQETLNVEKTKSDALKYLAIVLASIVLFSIFLL